METEFKYTVKDPSVFDRIVENAEINKMGIEAVETISMHANYFDTPDMDFRKHGIAYRIRQEDDRITATIKWDVTVEDGLHRREEFNLVVNDERFADQPDIDIFLSSEAYDVLYEAAGNKLFSGRQSVVQKGRELIDLGGKENPNRKIPKAEERPDALPE